MIITRQAATLGLVATASTSSTNVSGPNPIGQVPRRTSFPDSDIVYSFSAVSVAAADAATWAISTGVVTAGGSVVVAAGDGKDFEGTSLPGFDQIYGILVEFETKVVCTLTISSTESNFADVVLASSGSLLFVIESGVAAVGSMSFTFSAGAGTAEVTAIAKASTVMANVNSVNFQGDDEYMSTGTDGTLADKTYSFWAKSSDTSATAKNTIFSHGAKDKGGFHLNWSSSRPLLYMGTSNYRFWNDNSAQDDGAWHHYAVCVKASTPAGALLYIDSVLQSVNVDTGGVAGGAYSDLEIGRSGTAEFFTGNIDEFCVFDGHLSAAAILTLWNNGVPKDPTSLSPEHWWRMGDDGGSGTFIPDHADLGLGAELITGFTNGTSYPLDTFVTTGRDISSAIETTGNWGGCASNAFAVTVGEVYEVTFNLTYNSGTDDMRFKIVEGADGADGPRSGEYYSSANGANKQYIPVTSTDAVAHLQFGTGHAVDVINFSAADISCKLVNGKPGTLQSGAVIQTDAP